MSKNVLSNNNTPEENLEYLKSVLPTRGKLIDWKNSIGCTIEYEYEWYGKVYKGNLTIECYKPKGQKVYFKGVEKSIYTGNLQKCKLGGILNLKTDNFKFEIGDIINGILIIDREYRTIKGKKYKFYKYRCTCKNEDWINEGHLNQGQGCNVCCPNPRKAVLGRNTIWDKARWMVALGVSEEDAKKNTPQSSQKIEVTCPYCGRKKKCTISHIHDTHSIGCICGDGVSYPEKFIYSLLEQLNVKFEMQFSNFNWINNIRYDFYIPSVDLILEVHGGQHGKFIAKDELIFVKRTKGFTMSDRDDIKIDAEKCWLAYDNGIENYIQLDCNYSDMEYIKNSMLNSELANMFDLSKVDWNKCEEFACGNLVKKICDYWHEHREINGEDIFTKDIGEVFGLSKLTISRYLKQGSKLGWCNYDPKEENKRNGGQNNQPIYCPELNEIFISIADAERKLKINHNAISNVLTGRAKTSSGYHWKRVDKDSNYYKNYLISQSNSTISV